MLTANTPFLVITYHMRSERNLHHQHLSGSQQHSSSNHINTQQIQGEKFATGKEHVTGRLTAPVTLDMVLVAIVDVVLIAVVALVCIAVNVGRKDQHHN